MQKPRVLLRMEQNGRAASTRRNTYAMRVAFDDAVADDLLAVNPVLRVNRPRVVIDQAFSLSPRR